MKYFLYVTTKPNVYWASTIQGWEGNSSNFIHTVIYDTFEAADWIRWRKGNYHTVRQITIKDLFIRRLKG